MWCIHPGPQVYQWSVRKSTKTKKRGGVWSRGGQQMGRDERKHCQTQRLHTHKRTQIVRWDECLSGHKPATWQCLRVCVVHAKGQVSYKWTYTTLTVVVWSQIYCPWVSTTNSMSIFIQLCKIFTSPPDTKSDEDILDQKKPCRHIIPCPSEKQKVQLRWSRCSERVTNVQSQSQGHDLCIVADSMRSYDC